MSAQPTLSSHVAVIGLGAWGTALALHCARQGHQVTAWHRDPEIVRSLQASRTFSWRGSTLALPDAVAPTSSIADCASCEYCVIALPSGAWSEVVPFLKNKILISATKGIEKTSTRTPLSYAQHSLGRDPNSLCVISGPSFASDLVSQTPISLTAASKSLDTAHAVSRLLHSNTFRVYTSADPLGVELGGILKNIMAIAVGMSDGLSYGPSTRAALIARGLAEMTRIAVALGAQQQTLFGLSGLGDLIMTATEDQSRNRMVGLRLGRGEKLQDIVSTLASTAEGVTSAPLIHDLITKIGIDAPITSHVVQVLQGSLSPRDMAASLMSRPGRSEF